MSTEQLTLDAVDATRRTRTRDINTREARYRGADVVTQDRAPVDAGQCQTCGHDLPKHVQRVVGDNHGRVAGCIHCFVDQRGQPVSRWFAAAAGARDDPSWPARYEEVDG